MTIHGRKEPVALSPSSTSPNRVKDQDRYSQARSGRFADEPLVSRTLQEFFRRAPVPTNQEQAALVRQDTIAATNLPQGGPLRSLVTTCEAPMPSISDHVGPSQEFA